MANRDCLAALQINAAPQSHVLVGRRRIPINPVNSKVLFRLRDGFHAKRVRSITVHHRADIEIVSAVGSSNILSTRH